MASKWMPAHYPNTNKTIYSINELINDIVISYNILRLLHDMPITVEMLITGYPKVWKWHHTWHHKQTMELHKNSNAPLIYKPFPRQLSIVILSNSKEWADSFDNYPYPVRAPFNKTLCKQTVENPDRRRVLISVCTVCLCPTKRTLCIWVNNICP